MPLVKTVDNSFTRVADALSMAKLYAALSSSGVIVASVALENVIRYIPLKSDTWKRCCQHFQKYTKEFTVEPSGREFPRPAKFTSEDSAKVAAGILARRFPNHRFEVYRHTGNENSTHTLFAIRGNAFLMVNGARLVHIEHGKNVSCFQSVPPPAPKVVPRDTRTIREKYVVIRGDRVVRVALIGCRRKDELFANEATAILGAGPDELVYVRVGQQPEPVNAREYLPYSTHAAVKA